MSVGAGSVAHGFPVPLTRFIGRQRELADIGQLMKDARLLALIGPPGCGKTRLALHFAATAAGSYANGVWLAELAPLRDPTYLPQLITRILNIPRAHGQSALESLLHHLQSSEILLLLDNCEHLTHSCAQLVQLIVTRSDSVRILVTSREPLGIVGEATYPIAGLPYPPVGPMEAMDLLQYDAVRLFVDRASALLPQFEITTGNAAGIARICQRLDGLPLALELASAHANVLSLHEILAHLDDRFRLLISRQRHEPDGRHRTLRAAIDWSYDSLSTPEQVMLQRLSVFAGGCSLVAAETVCVGNGIELDQILGLLSSLVDKSLVVSHTLRRSEARYSLLETIRHYGQEKLIESGERPAIRDRHLGHFVELCEDTDTKLRGAYQQLWLAFLDGELDNIRAALDWALEGGGVSAGLRIVASLYQFWRIRNYIDEGLNWSSQLFAEASDEISPAIRAHALLYASIMAGMKGQLEDQQRYGAEAVALGEAAGEPGKATLAQALGALGFAARKAGDYQAAFDLIVRENQLLRDAGDKYMLGIALSLGSYFAMSAGEYDGAGAMLEEAFPLLRQAGDPFRLAMALNYAGDLARCRRNYHQAQAAYEESVSILRQINAVGDLASVLHNLGHACLHLGEFERATELFGESIASHRQQGNPSGMTEGLLGFAALAIAVGLPLAGRACWVLRQRLAGGKSPPNGPPPAWNMNTT